MIVGNIATGKSTFAKKLSHKLTIKVIHLDNLFFRPNCEFTPKEEWHNIVRTLADKDEWIIDGNYPNTLNIRAERADTIIIFDFPRYLSYFYFIKRNILKYFTKSIETDRSQFNCERVSFNTLKRIWIFKYKTQKYYSDFYQMGNKNILVFKKQTDAYQYLNSL